MIMEEMHGSKNTKALLLCIYSTVNQQHFRVIKWAWSQ